MKEIPIRTALISVTDKTGLSELAAVLKKRSVKILASSGTKKHLEALGIEAEEIADYTGNAELLGGRVKTLHPKIHAGILADRENTEHIRSLRAQGILPVDLVVVNLYPFREKYAAMSCSEKELCEFIDIGGITLIRAAAKNFHSVSVSTSPRQYSMIAGEIEASGNTTFKTRKLLALEAFRLTSSYDTAIEKFFAGLSADEKFPDTIPLSFDKVKELRYGENPHQKAALYRSHRDSYLLSHIQHQGKELSFNNYLDIIGAFSLARDLGRESVAIIKHTNPCGAAWCGHILTTFQRALECDSLSAFGGIVAANGEIKGETADAMLQIFLEVVLARSFDEGALERFSKKKNLRVITIPGKYWDEPCAGPFALYVENALLYQELDSGFPELEDAEVVTKKEPSDKEMAACRMAWKVAKHVKSNSIVIADDQGTAGIGAGQMSRVDSAKIALDKAKSAGFSLGGKIAASDAFFPFADGVIELAKSGISAVIQPGGSIKDSEVIEGANEAGIAMIFTGRRHFRHL